MGEDHKDFSHHITQALAFRKLVAGGNNVTFFLENPHNRLYTILLDRGHDADSASKLADYITAHDPTGHISAKALIGGNPNSVRGQTNFLSFAHQMGLQTAMHHGADIVYADAARVYPGDFCLDYSDPSTNEIASRLNARRGASGDIGPDDMLIRNEHMSQIIKARLEKTGGVGFVQVGAAHAFGINNVPNGLHLYQDSIAVRFQKLGLPAIITSLLPEHALPPDYKTAEEQQRHEFASPDPLILTSNVSNEKIGGFLATNDLNPNIYDPRKFAKSYREEFNSVLEHAKNAISAHIPIGTPNRNNRPTKGKFAFATLTS